MQDAFVMRGFDAGAGLPQERERTLHRNGAFAPQQLVKRLAFDKFHNEKEDAFLALAEIRNADDIRMLDRCSGTRLALEPRDRFTFLKILIRQNVRPNSFHRHAPRNQVFIARQIYLAHGAAAEALLKPIAPIQERRARQRVLGFGLIVGTDECLVFKAAFATGTFAHLAVSSRSGSISRCGKPVNWKPTIYWVRSRLDLLETGPKLLSLLAGPSGIIISPPQLSEEGRASGPGQCGREARVSVLWHRLLVCAAPIR